MVYDRTGFFLRQRKRARDQAQRNCNFEPGSSEGESVLSLHSSTSWGRPIPLPTQAMRKRHECLSRVFTWGLGKGRVRNSEIWGLRWMKHFIFISIDTHSYVCSSDFRGLSTAMGVLCLVWGNLAWSTEFSGHKSLFEGVVGSRAYGLRCKEYLSW